MLHNMLVMPAVCAWVRESESRSESLTHSWTRISTHMPLLAHANAHGHAHAIACMRSQWAAGLPRGPLRAPWLQHRHLCCAAPAHQQRPLVRRRLDVLLS